MKPIPYGRHNITNEDIQAVVETLKSDFLTQGPKVSEFENKFAGRIGAKYSVAVCNGTAALHIAALAIGIKAGDNIIVTPLTFVASANCVRYCGGNVSFCDIDKENYLIDIDKLHNMLKQKPKGYYKGIVPVDFAGYPVQGEKLRELANEYGLWIIEDACHAPGAYFIDSNNTKQNCGNGLFADLTAFSFHPVKHIATGEGGMVTTNNEELYNKLCLYRTHGITKSPSLLHENHGGWYYEMQELGFNYRMTDFQAALGISQLTRLNENLKKRNEIAKKYNEAFANTKGIITPKVDGNSFHAYHLYIIQVEDRAGLYNHLKLNNIFAQVHYEPVHTQPYYIKLGNKKGDFPIVEKYYERCLSLPMFPTLTEKEQNWVIEKIKEFIE
ncbi:MAG: UDP-4-amino-4,6-dideoxy-N-acetyl-beta-L-altrosamine transaminase [Bacteroidales bacterium]|jgi:UDP-4-amino-4,6-dideoxy-N-acetyl-beta-L-altrosamine transaminase